jgi:hypothetical protein
MRLRGTLAVVGISLLLAGCGGSDDAPEPSPTNEGPAALATPTAGGDEQEAPDQTATALGFPAFATRNTTRVAGADPVANAAGVALAAFPSASDDSRPGAVTLADAGDWQAAISAAQLMSSPLKAPVLLSEDGELPEATAAALEQLKPTGAAKAAGAQVIRVGAGPAPAGQDLEATDLTGADPAEVARRIDRLHAAAAGTRGSAVIVASSDAPAFAMPAAGLAVHTGAPVLWTGRDKVPAATVAAIQDRRRPRIYVIGPKEAVGDAAVKRLRRLGTVRRIAGADPVANAIAVARYGDGAFGWNVVDPGHGFVFAGAERTADAAAAAALSGTGTYGPLLLVSSADALPAAVQDYLLDVQPGYDRDPVRGVYNHGWLVGDPATISVAVQARIDSLLEIQPVDR